MRLTFKLEKVTKNYAKYRQANGINALYLPKPENDAPVTLEEFSIEVPDKTGA